MTRADRLHTGVRNLDGLCDGGLVRGSLTAISGPPGGTIEFVEAGGGMASILTVVKTRGSEHDRGTHRFSSGHGRVRPDREGASG